MHICINIFFRLNIGEIKFVKIVTVLSVVPDTRHYFERMRRIRANFCVRESRESHAFERAPFVFLQSTRARCIWQPIRPYKATNVLLRWPLPSRDRVPGESESGILCQNFPSSGRRRSSSSTSVSLKSLTILAWPR